MPHAYHRLGRYFIVEEIASGGMATVYHAKLKGPAGFEKDVAIKKILPAWSQQKEFAEMLIAEAKVLVHLSHPNIVQIFELAQERDNYFIVMEYVNGFDLRKIIKQLNHTGQKLPLELACHIIGHVATGLDFVHTSTSQGGKLLNIVHRDISPQNVLVSLNGEVKITDFGIARVIGKSPETQTGVLKGKFSYMSPEQALGKNVDQRTDIFALGLLFYELLTLRKCFNGSNDLETIEQVKKTAITLPDSLPAQLTAILSKTLARNVNERYQTAGEFLQDLGEFEMSSNCHAQQADLKQILSWLFTHQIHQTETDDNWSEQKTKILSKITKNPSHRHSALTVFEPKTIIARSPLPTHITLLHPKTVMEKKPSGKKQLIVGSATLLFCLAAVVIPNINLKGENRTERIPIPMNLPRIKTARADFMPQKHPLDGTTARQTSPRPHLAVTRPIEQKKNAMGKIHIEARPWGRAAIGRFGTKETPAEFKIPAGKHTISVSYPPLKKIISRVVTIGENQAKNCQASFSRWQKTLTCR